MAFSKAAARWAIALCPIVFVNGLTAVRSQPEPSATDVPHVVTTDGDLQGERTSSGGAIFRGIPYAAPPVGELRWRPPQPAPRWTGTRSATQPAPPCLQANVGWNRADSARSAEDCLYIDVRTPRLDPKAHLPVLVWIHGGANWGGSAGWVIDSALADRGVVVVTIQYRLGVFGFLSHPQLSRESPHRASGNYGLMDQVAGLQWVKRNISAFGGDPGAVTLAGHSAGGQDVGLLLLAPQARGLFARAIQQSGTAGFGLPARSLADNERLGEQLTERAGVARGERELEALRAVSGRKLLDAQMLLQSHTLADDSYIFLQAVVDGWVIPAPPRDLLQAGKSAPVPLMIGNAAQELTLNGGDSSVWRAVAEGFGTAAPAARMLYGLEEGFQPQDDTLLGSVAMQIADDLTFRCPAGFTASRHLQTGQPVWRYQMETAAPGAARVDHGSELGFIFGNLPLDPGIDGRQPYPQTYWVNFIRTGNPNGAGVPEWPRYTQDGAYLRLTHGGPVADHGLRTQLCALLQRP